jgi:hypothetical protein
MSTFVFLKLEFLHFVVRHFGLGQKILVRSISATLQSTAIAGNQIASAPHLVTTLINAWILIRLVKFAFFLPQFGFLQTGLPDGLFSNQKSKFG